MNRLRCSPFEFLYSRNQILTSDKIQEVVENFDSSETNLENQNQRKIAFILSVEKAKELRENENKRIAKGFPFDDLKIGSIVFKRILSANEKEKLGPKFEGPYTIIKVKEKGSYIIKGLDDKEI